MLSEPVLGTAFTWLQLRPPGLQASTLQRQSHMPQLHNRGSHSFRLSQDVNMQQQHSPDEGVEAGGGAQHPRTFPHTRAHMDSSTHTYGFHVFTKPGFFFSLSFPGDTPHPPTLCTEALARMQHVRCTQTHTPTRAHTPPHPHLSNIHGSRFSRRTASRIPLILPPSWLVALVSSHTPFHPRRRIEWTHRVGGVRRQTCSQPARQIYFQVPCI